VNWTKDRLPFTPVEFSPIIKRDRVGWRKIGILRGNDALDALDGWQSSNRRYMKRVPSQQAEPTWAMYAWGRRYDAVSLVRHVASFLHAKGGAK
jgi:hypothetical protein